MVLNSIMVGLLVAGTIGAVRGFIDHNLEVIGLSVLFIVIAGLLALKNLRSYKEEE